MAKKACCSLEVRSWSWCLLLQFGKIKIELLNLVSDLMRLPSKVSASAVEVRLQLPLKQAVHLCAGSFYYRALLSYSDHNT